ncbi:MAG: hypothetical protein OXI29_06925 [bacterium]|nr:hypothetical protein [bacterium]
MNTAILSSVIGGSAVLLASVIGVLFAHFLTIQRESQQKIDGQFHVLTGAIKDLDTKFAGVTTELGALDTKFTGAIKDLEIRLSNKFTVEINALDTRVNDQLKAHGERLARIEAKLEIDPPAEAA